MRRRVPAMVLAAWAVHDAEELIAIRGRAGQSLSGGTDISGHFARAVAAMAVIMSALAVEGVRTRGESALWRASVTAFGMHGIAHIGMSATVRAYTPGAVTAAGVVLPVSVFVHSRFDDEARSESRRVALLLPPALLFVALGVSHGVALVSTRVGDGGARCSR